MAERVDTVDPIDRLDIMAGGAQDISTLKAKSDSINQMIHLALDNTGKATGSLTKEDEAKNVEFTPAFTVDGEKTEESPDIFSELAEEDDKSYPDISESSAKTVKLLDHPKKGNSVNKDWIATLPEEILSRMDEVNAEILDLKIMNPGSLSMLGPLVISQGQITAKLSPYQQIKLRAAALYYPDVEPAAVDIVTCEMLFFIRKTEKVSEVTGAGAEAVSLLDTLDRNGILHWASAVSLFMYTNAEVEELASFPASHVSVVKTRLTETTVKYPDICRVFHLINYIKVEGEGGLLPIPSFLAHCAVFEEYLNYICTGKKHVGELLIEVSPRPALKPTRKYAEETHTRSDRGGGDVQGKRSTTGSGNVGSSLLKPGISSGVPKGTGSAKTSLPTEKEKPSLSENLRNEGKPKHSGVSRETTEFMHGAFNHEQFGWLLDSILEGQTELSATVAKMEVKLDTIIREQADLKKKLQNLDESFGVAMAQRGMEDLSKAVNLNQTLFRDLKQKEKMTDSNQREDSKGSLLTSSFSSAPPMKMALQEKSAKIIEEIEGVNQNTYEKVLSLVHQFYDEIGHPNLKQNVTLSVMKNSAARKRLVKRIREQTSSLI